MTPDFLHCGRAAAAGADASGGHSDSLWYQGEVLRPATAGKRHGRKDPMRKARLRALKSHVGCRHPHRTAECHRGQQVLQELWGKTQPAGTSRIEAPVLSLVATALSHRHARGHTLRRSQSRGTQLLRAPARRRTASPVRAPQTKTIVSSEPQHRQARRTAFA